ncbi:hypothetical protein HMP0721_1132 [Pseudoramibacter alactolyticus ATCC 23263]|uniref:Uncharacterized protein n=1 Tax=Pseudoramibacter alactolyticus ATCC 23263 TaxID=887929 RepID=E6MGJ9_9FIRM|nr:hypothetical protein HMP0721_1132 [Pseudoramibacter alactolyticus ATCC 23263]
MSLPEKPAADIAAHHQKTQDMPAKKTKTASDYFSDTVCLQF